MKGKILMVVMITVILCSVLASAACVKYEGELDSINGFSDLVIVSVDSYDKFKFGFIDFDEDGYSDNDLYDVKEGDSIEEYYCSSTSISPIMSDFINCPNGIETVAYMGGNFARCVEESSFDCCVCFDGNDWDQVNSVCNVDAIVRTGCMQDFSTQCGGTVEESCDCCACGIQDAIGYTFLQTDECADCWSNDLYSSFSALGQGCIDNELESGLCSQENCNNLKDDDGDLIWGNDGSIIGGGIDSDGGCVFMQARSIIDLNNMDIELSVSGTEISEDVCLAQEGVWIPADDCCGNGDEWGVVANSFSDMSLFRCADGIDNDGDGNIDFWGACQISSEIVTCNMKEDIYTRATSERSCIIDYDSGETCASVGGIYIPYDVECTNPFYYENGFVAKSRVGLELVSVDDDSAFVRLIKSVFGSGATTNAILNIF
jgi:hypothetical protein